MQNNAYSDEAGRVWNRYACSFESPDGKYAFEIWAISREHAELQLLSLKETAIVDGRIELEIPGNFC